jgi:hypothetical protein
LFTGSVNPNSWREVSDNFSASPISFFMQGIVTNE